MMMVTVGFLLPWELIHLKQTIDNNAIKRKKDFNWEKKRSASFINDVLVYKAALYTFDRRNGAHLVLAPL